MEGRANQVLVKGEEAGCDWRGQVEQGISGREGQTGGMYTNTPQWSEANRLSKEGAIGLLVEVKE